jgi:hypothetical protein
VVLFFLLLLAKRKSETAPAEQKVENKHQKIKETETHNTNNIPSKDTTTKQTHVQNTNNTTNNKSSEEKTKATIQNTSGLSSLLGDYYSDDDEEEGN